MRVLVCANAVQGTMPQLLDGLNGAGIDAEWGAPPGAFDWPARLRWYAQAVRHLPESEPVILSDGWDVIFNGTKEEVAGKIPADRILISGEKNCWPDAPVQIRYPQGATPWQYVNAGNIAGPAGLLAEALSRMDDETMSPFVGNDQRFWTKLFLDDLGNESRRFVIDQQCELFQSINLMIHWLEREIEHRDEGPRFRNKRTGSYPNFIHANGMPGIPTELLEALGMSS